jgi:hypothetical protein
MDNPGVQYVEFNTFNYCGTAMDLRLRTVGVWVWVPDTTPPITTCFLSASPNVHFDQAFVTPPPKSTWFKLTGRFSASDNLVESIRVECDGMADYGASWYLDDLTIE